MVAQITLNLGSQTIPTGARYVTKLRQLGQIGETRQEAGEWQAPGLKRASLTPGQPRNLCAPSSECPKKPEIQTLSRNVPMFKSIKFQFPPCFSQTLIQKKASE